MNGLMLEITHEQAALLFTRRLINHKQFIRLSLAIKKLQRIAI